MVEGWKEGEERKEKTERGKGLKRGRWDGEQRDNVKEGGREGGREGVEEKCVRRRRRERREGGWDKYANLGWQ